MRPFLEAVRPLVSFLVALVLFMIWATYSPNNILEADPRLFFYLSGMVPYKQADLQSQGEGWEMDPQKYSRSVLSGSSPFWYID